MSNNETLEEQGVREESPKGNRRPGLPIFGGVLLVGALMEVRYPGDNLGVTTGREWIHPH